MAITVERFWWEEWCSKSWATEIWLQFMVLVKGKVPSRRRDLDEMAITAVRSGSQGA